MRHPIGILFVGWTIALPTVVRAAPFAYVADRDAPSISVIDLASNTVATTIPITAGSGREPYWAAVSRNGATAAVSLHNDEVALVDGRTNTLIDIVSTPAGEAEPVAVSSNGKTVYVGDEFGDLHVVDVATRMVTKSIDIDASPPGICDGAENMVITPDDRRLFITCEDGGTTIRVDIETSQIEKIADSGQHGIALNCAGTLLYYGDGQDVLEYSVGSAALTGRKLLGCNFYGGSVSPDGKRFYCVEESDNLRIYDLSDASFVTELTLSDNNATAVAVSPDSTRVYVPTSQDDKVNVVNALTPADLLPTIGVGDGPRGIAIANCETPLRTPAPALSPAGLLAASALLAAAGVVLARRHLRRRAQRIDRYCS